MTVFLKDGTSRKWVLYSVLTAALSSITMGIVAIEYANHAINESTHQWCEVVNTLNEGYRKTPPQTPAQKQLAEEFARLATQFKCEE